MNQDVPTVVSEVVRHSPLPAAAWLLSFVNTYGATVVLILSISYGIMQMYLRAKEHKAIMRKNEVKE